MPEWVEITIYVGLLVITGGVVGTMHVVTERDVRRWRRRWQREREQERLERNVDLKYQQIRREVHDEIRREIRQELRNELRAEIRREVEGLERRLGSRIDAAPRRRIEASRERGRYLGAG